MHLRKHAIPIIGTVRLAQLNRMHLQHLYANCMEGGLSPTTTNHLHGALYQALDEAMRSDLVPRNVAALADPPRVEKREMQIYTPEQVDKLLNAAKGHRLEALIALTVATAMRAGELLALRWTHIDMAGGVLHVKRTRTRVARGYTEGKPKTASGTRDIKLIPLALDALRAHKRRQAEERLRMGDAWQDEDRVFPSSIGTALDPANLTEQWYKIIALAGLPEIHFHDLRHSAASWLLCKGVSIADVSQMLGHADPSITLRIYAHLCARDAGLA
jgi:integrase